MPSDTRYAYIRHRGAQHEVSWHPISKEVYVYSRNWWYAGKADSLQDALDRALSYLNSKGW